MDRTKFFVDENSLAHEIAQPNPSIDRLEQIVEVTSTILDANDACRTYFFKNFYSLTVNGTNIAQIMFGNYVSGDFRDIFLRIQLLVDRSENYTNANGAPIPGFQALIANKSGGWISLNSPIGLRGWDPKFMAWVPTSNSFPPALRQLYISCGRAITSLDRYAPFLFPNIYFHAKASDISKTGLSYSSILPTYFNHLSYLNDQATIHFASTPLHHLIISKAATAGVEISPESPNTHNDKDAMKKRNIIISNQTICCEWHTKLTKTSGRIHFFARKPDNEKVSEVVGEKAIVGIITNHLP